MGPRPLLQALRLKGAGPVAPSGLGWIPASLPWPFVLTLQRPTRALALPSPPSDLQFPASLFLWLCSPFRRDSSESYFGGRHEAAILGTRLGVGEIGLKRGLLPGQGLQGVWSGALCLDFPSLGPPLPHPQPYGKRDLEDKIRGQVACLLKQRDLREEGGAPLCLQAAPHRPPHHSPLRNLRSRARLGQPLCSPCLPVALGEQEAPYPNEKR